MNWPGEEIAVGPAAAIRATSPRPGPYQRGYPVTPSNEPAYYPRPGLDIRHPDYSARLINEGLRQAEQRLLEPDGTARALLPSLNPDGTPNPGALFEMTGVPSLYRGGVSVHDAFASPEYQGRPGAAMGRAALGIGETALGALPGTAAGALLSRPAKTPVSVANQIGEALDAPVAITGDPAADPLFSRSIPQERGPLPPSIFNMPNEDRYLFGRPAPEAPPLVGGTPEAMQRARVDGDRLAISRTDDFADVPPLPRPGEMGSGLFGELPAFRSLENPNASGASARSGGSAYRQANAPRGDTPFHDPRLTPDQSFAVQQRLNGYTPAEIAGQMDTSPNVVRVHLNNARKRAPDLDIPRSVGGRVAGHGALVNTPSKDDLLGMSARGLTDAQIAERTGLTQANVKVRLWRYRNGVDAIASAVALPAGMVASGIFSQPSKRRAN